MSMIDHHVLVVTLVATKRGSYRCFPHSIQTSTQDSVVVFFWANDNCTTTHASTKDVTHEPHRLNWH